MQIPRKRHFTLLLFTIGSTNTHKHVYIHRALKNDDKTKREEDGLILPLRWIAGCFNHRSRRGGSYKLSGLRDGSPVFRMSAARRGVGRG